MLGNFRKILKRTLRDFLDHIGLVITKSFIVLLGTLYLDRNYKNGIIIYILEAESHYEKWRIEYLEIFIVVLKLRTQ